MSGDPLWPAGHLPLEGGDTNHLDYRHDCCTISVHKREGSSGEAGV